MENSSNELTLHPHLLEALFAFKNKVSAVFRDVLGIHEINHIAITRINSNHQLSTFSSTPAMEFNLFSSALWRFDDSYNPQWFNLCTQNYWEKLYDQARYDELYYIKQIKHAFPIGLSMAAQLDDNKVIYSLASHKSCAHTRELFSTQQEDFYKIGQYCSNMLNPLFNYCDTWTSPSLATQV
jgi:hypothetical protein